MRSSLQLAKMYKEYEKAYKHYSVKYGVNTAIFYQVGKFYEMYDWLDAATGEGSTSVKRATELLGIQLAIRKGDGPGGTTGLFAGVPEQSLHKYGTILTNAGWIVVVFDQVRDAKGAITERAVKRVLTPGTHVEAAMGADAVSIAGIWLEGAAWGSRAAPTFGLTSLDLTTGAIITYESAAIGKDDSWTAEDAFHFFQVHAPRECIVWWRGAEVDQPGADLLRRQFGLLGARIQIVQADAKSQGGYEIPLVREDCLRRSIPIRGLLPIREALALTRTPLVERSLCAIIGRIEESYPSGPKQLHMPEVWSPATNLFLGNHALLQLNMICPRQEDSVLGLFMRTKTPMGQRAMRRRILHPIADVGRLNRRYDEISCIGDKGEALERHLSQIADLPRIHRRITTADVTPADILALEQSYSCMEKIMAALQATPLKIPAAEALINPFQDFRRFFSVEKAMVASEDAFCFQDAEAPDVAAIEAEICAKYEAMAATARELESWAGLPPDSLRLEFRETLGPTLTGTKAVMKLLTDRLQKSGGTKFAAARIQVKKSSTSLELPTLDELYRTILRLRSNLAAAVRTAMSHISQTITERCLDHWDTLEAWISNVDVTFTLWQRCTDLGFVRPLLVPGEAATVRLEGLRHPLIEATAVRTEYVRHSITLDDAATGWLVYGMNASGKSSLMKAVGIAVLLAQAGCYVPASQMTMTPFRGIYTRILNTDNLWAGLSSFAVEMTELREILQRADKWSLVLGDELCSGTESVSATALVGAGLEWLHGRGARFIFATHLHGLMNISRIRGLERLKVWHLKVRYDLATERLVYDRTLTPGPGSSLYGLEVARAMNIPDRVLAAAMEIRHEILGTASTADAPMSAWNSGVQRKECAKCGSGVVRDLEVHHIQMRSGADAVGRLADGTHQNHIRNLIVLCEACHQKHHAGGLEVAPLKASSSEAAAAAEEPEAAAKKPLQRTKWSPEQIEIIRGYLRNFPKVAPKRLVYDLEEKESIVISVASLARFRTSL